MCFRSAGNWSVLAVVYSPCFWAFGSFYEFKLVSMRLEDPRVELISVSITWTLEISPVEAQCCPADSVRQHLRFAHLSSVFNLSWIAIKLEPVYKIYSFSQTWKSEWSHSEHFTAEMCSSLSFCCSLCMKPFSERLHVPCCWWASEVDLGYQLIS